MSHSVLSIPGTAEVKGGTIAPQLKENFNGTLFAGIATRVFDVGSDRGLEKQMASLLRAPCEHASPEKRPVTQLELLPRCLAAIEWRRRRVV